LAAGQPEMGANAPLVSREERSDEPTSAARRLSDTLLLHTFVAGANLSQPHTPPPGLGEQEKYVAEGKM